MNHSDIRWIQRFSNFERTLKQLSRFVKKGNLNELEQQGLIQSFEYNYELAWNVIKDFYEFQGESNIQGSKDAIRLAFKRELIRDGELWMKMVKSRSLTSHTYNETTAEEVVHAILNEYYAAFASLHNTMTEILKKQQ
ncbi:nucleotidyltransferase substrate binding protein [Simkania negevensis]|uniref:Nucleotidyltransferase substrate binding protein n=1 Tax=Simkania negevensis TaxID=83561 RepID=A0ABS3ARS1_9BACT|nr:nucleotidyltransferase substrate binding protein [Simkania negevensis]